jgi:muramoyltetrapeptide carboxypeptidase
MLSGFFKRVVGVALGDFDVCSGRAEFYDLIVDRLGQLGIPILADLPFGHRGLNTTIPVGAFAELDTSTTLLSWNWEHSITTEVLNKFKGWFDSFCRRKSDTP